MGQSCLTKSDVPDSKLSSVAPALRSENLRNSLGTRPMRFRSLAKFRGGGHNIFEISPKSEAHGPTISDGSANTEAQILGIWQLQGKCEVHCLYIFQV